MSHRPRILGLCGAGFLFFQAAVCRGDFVLLQDGMGLFNVTVEDTMSTWSRSLKIRYRPMSFEYDYSRDTVHALLGFGNFHDVADFYSTGTEVGKASAREWMASKRWQTYTPPVKVPVMPFTPAPRIIYTPPPQNTPPPDNIADAQLPLNQRIQAQLDIFINEQQTLASAIKNAISLKQLDEQKGKNERLKLLGYQQKILKENYPDSEELVSKAMEALTQQAKVVEQKGKFNFEY